MASSLNSDNGVVSGSSGLKSTADTSGVLALQSNGSTALSVGTDLNVTLTNATANGVFYSNGSKVLTSGSALTFDGTNLGIGVASPTLRIQAAVSGATTTFDGLNVTNGTATFRLGVTGATYSYAGASSNETWLYSSGTTPLTLGPDGNAPIKFVSNGSEQMRLTSTGLGIGTSSPADKLQVLGTIRFGANATYYGTITHDAASTGANIYNHVDSGGHLFQVGGTTLLNLTAAGNLGLGVTPSAWGSGYKAFEFGSGGSSLFSGTSTAAQTYLTANAYFNGTSWIYKNTAIASYYEQSGGKHIWYNAPSGTAGNAISFSQAMTLDASGNLLVGTTSTGYTSSNSTYYTPSSAYWINNHATGTASGTRYIGFGIGVNEVGSITQSGTTAVTYNTSSDYRLKNITGTLTGYKERLMSLLPKQGTWIADGSEFRGFLAHEFANPYRASVTGEKDAVDADGKPVMQSMQASSSEVMADLVAMIQEQQAIIQQLQADVAALKGTT